VNEGVTETITLQAFFEGVRAGRLTGIRCGGCGAIQVPPHEFCPECLARAWEPVPLAGDGEILSYTVIRVAPARHAAAAPYGVAVVRLHEGVSLIGRTVDIPLERLAIGLPVRFTPIIDNARTVIGFAAG
jgi:uncharacterized OB-fold protein